MDVVNKSLLNSINNAYSVDSNEFKSSNSELEVKEQRIQSVDNDKKVFSESSEKKNDYTKKELDDALKKVNNFLKDEKTHAEYSVHDDLGTLMIKIIDDDSKKVILEIPPKNILDMVASMCKQVGLLDKKA